MKFGASTWKDPITFRATGVTYLDGILTGTDNASFTFVGMPVYVRDGGATTLGTGITFGSSLIFERGANFTTNGGNFSATSMNTQGYTLSPINITTGGGNITISAAVSSNNTPSAPTGKLLALNAGTGTISFGSTVNGVNDITANAGTFSFTGAWGGTTALGNVSLTSNNTSFTLPTYTGTGNLTLNAGTGTITTGAITTGAGNLGITADDVALGGNITGTGVLTLQPLSTNRTVRVNNGMVDGTNFNLSTAEVGYLQNGWGSINIGRADATNGYSYFATSTWNDPVTFRGYITVANGAISGLGDSSITFNATSRAEAYNGGSLSTQNQSITYLSTLNLVNPTSAFTINSNGGAISFTSLVGAYQDSKMNVASAGGNISISGNVSSISPAANTLQSIALNAGAGSLGFGGTVNGSTYGGFDLTASAANLLFNGAWGDTTTLANVSLTSANALTLPSITANTILARTTGASADLTLASGKVLTASGTGNAILLAAGRNFINSAGASALNLTGAGRWLIYSTNPTGTTGEETLGATFNRYSCGYTASGTCASGTITVAGTGNGLLYSYTPLLTVTGNTQNLIYGDAPTLSSYGYTLTGYNSGDSTVDSVTGALTGSSPYAAGIDVGTYALNYAAGTLNSTLGYGFTYANNPTAIVVTPRTLTAALAGTVSKTYDGNMDATLNAGNYSLGNFYGSDGASVALNNPTSGSYDTKNADTGKTVSVTGLALSGAKSGNYVLASSSISGTVGTILKKVLALTGITASNKTYDATTTATLAGTGAFSGLVGSDDVTLGGTGVGTFGDKNVGTGKAVTVTGYTIAGTDAGNYTLSQPTGVTASITPKLLTLSGITANNKVYDGTDSASLSGSGVLSGVLGSDVVSVAGTGAGTFDDKNVGTGKTVTVTGYSLAGSAAGNYTVSQPTGIVASITKKLLTLTGLGATSKTYDATTVATLTGTAALAGVIGGDTVTLAGTGTGSFVDANAGTGKAVNVTGYSLGGTDAGNYDVSTTTGIVATITKKLLTVTANAMSMVYADAIPAGTVSYSGFAGSDTASAITTAPTVVSARSGLQDVGTYTNNFTASGAAAQNYSFTYASGNLIVTPRALLVSTANARKLTSQPDPLFSGSNNLLASDAALVSWLYAPANYSNAAGSYRIEATATDTSNRLANYIRTNDYGTFTVGGTDTSTLPPPVLRGFVEPYIPTYMVINVPSEGNGSRNERIDSITGFKGAPLQSPKDVNITISPDLMEQLHARSDI